MGLMGKEERGSESKGKGGVVELELAQFEGLVGSVCTEGISL